MFEKMVLSTAGRRERRLSRFFVGSAIAYVLLAGSALAVSIYVSDPTLTGFGAGPRIGPVVLVSASDGGHRPSGPKIPTSARPNLYSPATLDIIVRRANTQMPPPAVPSIEVPGDGSQTDLVGGGGSGKGDPHGLSFLPSSWTDEPPPVPRQLKKVSETAESQHQRQRTVLPVSQPVLQGKAIFRKTPDYPTLARITKREGSVVVEVVISPEGRVESARAISGDPLFAATAVGAALEWRFQPTYLGSVAVRVAGAITFVFKLAQ